jgi:hypothetical protein
MCTGNLTPCQQNLSLVPSLCFFYPAAGASQCLYGFCVAANAKFVQSM